MSETRQTEDLADLYEEAPCGYLSLAPDRRIVRANQTLGRWLGRLPEELLGKPFHDILSFGGRIAFETHLAPLLRLQGVVDEVAIDILHADGSKIPVLANAAEKRDADGQLLFTRFTLIKAFELRSYERNLKVSLANAEQAFFAEQENAVLREEFIAVLGHDLRNPLAAIAAGIDMIRKRETLTERGDRVIFEMAASMARASGLIDNVLDFARNRLGNGLAVSREFVQLTPILEQVANELRSIAPDREILTDFSINEPIDCDRIKIGQLAGNLLSNAITHGAPEVPIRFQADMTLTHLKISVSNGGPPLDAKTRNQLFEPFFRGEVRHSQNGLGLGLFIVSEIAKAHGGSVEVISSEDETRFTFVMPI